MLEREPLRDFECRTGWYLGEIAIVELGRGLPCRTHCVARDLSGGVRQGPNPKRRLERLGNRALRRVGRQLGQASD